MSSWLRNTGSFTQPSWSGICPGWHLQSTKGRAAPYLSNSWSIWGLVSTHTASGPFYWNPVPLIQGRHVLKSTNNRTTKVYINRQGRVRFNALLRTCDQRASENRGAQLVSRGSLLPDKWRAPTPWRFGHGLEKQKCICSAPNSTPTARIGSLWCLRMIHMFSHVPWSREMLMPSHYFVSSILLERVKLEQLSVILVAPDHCLPVTVVSRSDSDDDESALYDSPILRGSVP